MGAHVHIQRVRVASTHKLIDDHFATQLDATQYNRPFAACGSGHPCAIQYNTSSPSTLGYTLTLWLDICVQQCVVILW